MAFCRRLMVWLLILELVFMAVFVHSFCPKSSKELINMLNTSSKQKSGSNGDSGRGASAARNGVENSEREVPTGPDPLHHRDNPTAP